MLTEERRTQLDGIVQQMITNDEPDDNIQFVVDDFKQKYEALDTPIKEDKSFLKKAAGFVGDVTGVTGTAKAVGEAAKVAKGLVTGKEYTPSITAPQAAGSFAKLGITGATLGSGGLAGGIPGAVGTLARSAELAGMSGAYQVAENVEKQKPLGEGVKGAIVTGALIPPVFEGGAKLLSKGAKLASDQAPRVINSLIKPLLKDFSYGKNPGRTVSDLGITANSLEELGQKISAARQTIGEKIGAIGSELSGVSQKGLVRSPQKQLLDLNPSLKYIDDAMDTAAQHNNTSLLQRLENVKRALTENLARGIDDSGAATVVSKGSKKLDNLTYNEGFNLKKIIGDMTQWTGNKSDDEAVNGALKKTYGYIKDALGKNAESINPKLAKDLNKLNEQYADLTSADVATRYRGKIEDRQALTSLKGNTAALGLSILQSIASGGVGLGTVVAGATGVALDTLAGSTAFKTRLAKSLSALAPEEQVVLKRSIPALNRILGPTGLKGEGAILETTIKKIGKGTFGDIFEGFKGKKAVDFLIKNKDGEVVNALSHPEIGGIDLIWGKTGDKGYGLAHIAEKHPEILSTLDRDLSNSKIVERLPDKHILLETTTGQRAVVDLQYNNTKKTWLVTAYRPIK